MMNQLNDNSLYAVFSRVIRYHYSRVHMLLEKIGVYPGQPPLLFILGKQNGQSQNELAKKIHLKAATMTVMLNRMERAGLIERRSDENDQRVSRVYLTEQGKQLGLKVNETLMVMEEECFQNFTTEEKVLLRRLLLQMLDNLKMVCDKNCEHNS